MGPSAPDIQRVLKLLAGVELYGDEMVAVRELIQNAFDAVRERIARERLHDPDNPGRAELLGRLYSVEVGLEERDGTFWLVCRDQGAGMTKSILRDHLLVSGAVRRDDLLRLSRRCEAAGFRLERTAKFGIGVLSYFMIGDQVHIRTRRCQAALAGETTGWSFVTDGLNGFGELKQDRNCPEGTEVGLYIKPSVLGDDPAAFWRRLVAYLQRLLTRTPCRLIVAAEPLSQIRWTLDSPGWIRDGADYAEQSLSVLAPQLRSPTHHADLSEDPDDFVPSHRRSSWTKARDRQQELHAEAHHRLRWSHPVTLNRVVEPVRR